MNCPRCYITEGERSNRQIMSTETLTKVLTLKCVQDRAKDQPITLCWLGGEVLTIPLSVLEEYKKIIKQYAPNAINRLTTNLYSLKNEHIDFIKNTFNSVETTYASGHKFSKDGSEYKYQHKFVKNLKKLRENGILCHVNVELNRETYNKGIDPIIEIIKETKQPSWEFDISVQFDKIFEEGVNINDYQYATNVPLSITYREWASFVIKFLTEKRDVLRQYGVRIGFIDSCFSKNNDRFKLSDQT